MGLTASTYCYGDVTPVCTFLSLQHSYFDTACSSRATSTNEVLMSVVRERTGMPGSCLGEL